MDTTLNSNCFHEEGKSLLVGDIEECEEDETDKLLQNHNDDGELDAKLKESILSLLKSEKYITDSDLESIIKASMEEKQMAHQEPSESTISTENEEIEIQIVPVSIGQDTFSLYDV